MDKRFLSNLNCSAHIVMDMSTAELASGVLLDLRYRPETTSLQSGVFNRMDAETVAREKMPYLVGSALSSCFRPTQLSTISIVQTVC